MRSILFIALLFALSACSSAKVRARTLYVGRDNLASYVRDTPDPEKETTELGQVVWICWSVPKQYDHLQLDVTLRFTNGTERCEQYPVTGLFGTLSVESPSKEQKERGPILSYQILLKNGDQLISSTKHKLWVEKVQISEHT